MDPQTRPGPQQLGTTACAYSNPEGKPNTTGTSMEALMSDLLHGLIEILFFIFGYFRPILGEYLELAFALFLVLKALAVFIFGGRRRRKPDPEC